MRKFYSFLFAIIAFIPLDAQVYVDLNATGSNDGSSWTNAFTDLNIAASEAPDNSELWITSGTYRLTSILEMDQRGISIYGSFNGTETNISQRTSDPSTVISGDVNGDDVQGDFITNSEDNLTHVIMIEQTSPITLDGLIIQGGRAEGNAASVFVEVATGGGIRCAGQITFNNMIFRDNFARSGAGLFLWSEIDVPGSYTITDCVFENNEATNHGGGIYSGRGGTQATISNSVFRNNMSREAGGILIAGAFEETHVLFENCDFNDNIAELAGGAVETEGFGRPIFENCTFRNNKAPRGGAVNMNDQSFASFEDCIFENNEAITGEGEAALGGAIYLEEGSDAMILNCMFQRNSAIDAGGAICNVSLDIGDGSTIEIDGSSFIENNSPLGQGGAIYSQDMIEMVLSDVTFSSNSAQRGGAVRTRERTFITADDCDFLFNKAALGGGLIVGDKSSFMGTHWFGNEAIEDDDYYGAGGGMYIRSAEVDLFKCEFDENFSTDWAGGINIVDFGGTPSTVRINESIFAQNLAFRFGGGIYAQGESDIHISNSEYVGNESTEGGGIMTNGATILDVEESDFLQNEASYGGAILVNAYDDEITIEQSDFIENHSFVDGGAFYNYRGAKSRIRNNLFHKNSSEGWGGSVYSIGTFSDELSIFSGNTFDSNLANQSAGAIYHGNGNIFILNNLFHNNAAQGDGIGNAIASNQWEDFQYKMVLLNNTFHEDSSGLGTVVQWADDGLISKIEARNNIFSGDGVTWAREAGEVEFSSLGGNLVSKDDDEGIFTDERDIVNKDPKFGSVENEMFKLSERSPAIDAGVNEGAPSVDILKVLRDQKVDIGAYEFDDNCMPDGANVILASSGMKLELCAGNVKFSMRNSSTSGLPYYYVITDDEDKILDYQESDESTLDLSDAPEGECHVWGVSTNRPFLFEVGKQIQELSDENCTDVSSDYVQVFRLSEEICNEPCHAPRNLRARPNGSKTHVRWSRVDGARHYEVKIVYEGSSFESVTRVSRNSIRLSKSNKTYKISVRAICGSGMESDFSDEVTVQAPVTNAMASAFAPVDPNSTSDLQNINVLVFPNPLRNKLNIQLDKLNGMGTVQIFDLMGALKLENDVNFDQTISINISTLNDGIFLLNVMNEDGQIYQQRIVKSTE